MNPDMGMFGGYEPPASALFIVPGLKGYDPDDTGYVMSADGMNVMATLNKISRAPMEAANVGATNRIAFRKAQSGVSRGGF